MSQYSYCPYCLRPLISGQHCECGMDPGAYRAESYQIPAGPLLAGRYFIGRVLGEGGFGITYLGLDTKLGFPVAIKEYFPRALVHRNSLKTLKVTGYSGSEETFEKGKSAFLQEANTLAKMSGIPQIVGVHDFFPENNSAYIVMEYLQGWTLKKTVSLQGAMPAKYVLGIMDPVLRAMDSMHSLGQLHRDISPDNVMMLSKDGQLKLMDFGCSREMGGHTMTAIVKPGYAPVETTTGYGQGPWSDIYGICATMYYCMTGTVPADAVRRMEKDSLVPPSQLGAALTQTQERALLKGMAVGVKDRWKSVKELYEALYGRKLVPILPYDPSGEDGHVQTDMGDVTHYVQDATDKESSEEEKKPVVVPWWKRKGTVAGLCLLLGLVVCGVLFWFLHPHWYGQWTAVQAAACEEPGTEERSCFCGETQQRSIPSTGHQLVTDTAVAASCVETGLTEGSHCAVCGYIAVAQQTVDAKGHTVVTSPAVAATCSAEGKTEGAHCSDCGLIIQKQDVISKLEHTPVIDAASAATCTREGKSEGSHCAQCGTVLVAQKTVEKAAHTVVTDQAVAATCTEDGLTEGSHCSVCGLVLEAQKTEKALGHQYTDRKCTLCGAYKPSEGLAYELNGDHYIVSIGQCTDSHVVIPSTYNGKPVAQIAKYGFKSSSITKVTIPSSVKTIGDCAFFLCTSLTSVTIPSGVTKIGVAAFSGSSLTSVTIPSTVSEIEEGAFQLCTSLESVTIKKGVKTIGADAFQFCSNLASVSIPSSVTKIGERAFERCYDLRNVVIPSSVTSIGERAFVQCRMDTIYCRASSQPSGWHENWNVIEDESNDSRFSVVWGYSG